MGGNLSPGMLLSAYRQGVFPWYSEGDPILWWCPDPRFVVPLEKVHLSRSMARSLRRGVFRLSVDEDFAGVIERCAQTPRPGQQGTWITAEMLQAYRTLHQLGYAHSCEAWLKEELVGGIYGVAVGRLFFGESMFSHVTDASKAAFHALTAFLRQHSFTVMDSQVRTAHVARLGGIDIPRERFLKIVERDTNLLPLYEWRQQFDEGSVVKAAVAHKLAQN